MLDVTNTADDLAWTCHHVDGCLLFNELLCFWLLQEMV